MVIMMAVMRSVSVKITVITYKTLAVTHANKEINLQWMLALLVKYMLVSR